MFRTLSLLLACTPLVACASQVDGDHQGTALAKLTGEVRNTRTMPIAGDNAEVSIVWVNSSGSPDVSVAESADVIGSFPAQFSLSIYEPPAMPLLNDWNGVKVGVALIVAGTSDLDWTAGEPAGLLGMDENHLLVYVPQDVPAGSAASILLRGTPAAGFHIYGVHKLTDAESDSRRTCIEQLGPDPSMQEVYSQCGGSDVFDDFVPLPTDLATPLEIDLVDDLDQIDPPNWT